MGKLTLTVVYILHHYMSSRKKHVGNNENKLVEDMCDLHVHLHMNKRGVLKKIEKNVYHRSPVVITEERNVHNNP